MPLKQMLFANLKFSEIYFVVMTDLYLGQLQYDLSLPGPINAQ
jgi:hypothetical protein